MNGNARHLAHLDGGGLVLTRDARQARILRRLHDQAQVAAGRGAWPTAQVLPLAAWLEARWREAGADREDLPVALSALAVRWLWRGLVAADATGLVDAADVGARARASWLLLRAHGGSVEDLARWPRTRDQQAFFGWSREAERALAARHAFDADDLARRFVAENALPAPGPPILLVGFHRPTPAQAALFEALGRRGWAVSTADPARPGGTACRHAAADPASEQAAFVAWLRTRLAEAPDGVHGLVVPDLASRRGALERALEAALQPALELAAPPRDRVFDLAGGPPLAARAVVEAAVDAIRFSLGLGEWRTATRLLRSSHLASVAPELEARVRLDLRLRREGRGHVDLPAALARAARAAGAAAFASALEAAAARMSGATRRPAGAWAEAFGACLAAWQWARGSGTGSADWQAADRLSELLREFDAVAAFAQDLTAEQALAELEGLVQSPFQPEGGEPAVFVLGGWEEPGLAFDSLWVSGLTAAAWPRPVRVDPFLPIEVQRRLGMPRVTAESSAAEAATITAAWQAQAGILVMSSPLREDDTDSDPSPLVPEGLPTLPAPAVLRVRASLQCEAAALERPDGDEAPALGSGRAAGGTRLLELQARCPFRAFGELRLHAAPLEEPQPGLDRRLRGQILHRSLERFWSGLGSQDALLALDPADCERRAQQAVDEALAAIVPPALGPRMRALERGWQLRAVAGLLALDRARSPFAVVETEREMTGKIGGLELRLRADRIDDVEGSLVVIDYKTGRVRGTSWRGARMDAPQLPLYAVLRKGRAAAIAFAEAGVGGARFVGVGDEAVAIDGVVPAESYVLTEDKEKGFGWRAMTERWWAWLEALARDHAAGRAAVDPKLAANTCRQCHLGALCRVDAAGAREDLEGEADDGD